jgi:hypothetical protein
LRRPSSFRWLTAVALLREDGRGERVNMIELTAGK